MLQPKRVKYRKTHEGSEEARRTQVILLSLVILGCRLKKRLG